MDITIESILHFALRYAKLGWRVVPLFGLREDGSCECANSKCEAQGKHPRLRAWFKAATTEEAVIKSWWSKWPNANVGVVLGEHSGIVDFETDTATDEQNLLELFDGDPPATCSYKSGRSKGRHWLFQWRAEFVAGNWPSIVHWKTLGIRIGPNAQSVFPPSRHKAGAIYTWVVDPEECPPAPLPDSVVAKLVNSVGAGFVAEERKPSARQRLYKQPTIIETVDERDNTLYAEACALWREQLIVHGPACFESPEIQAIVYERIWAWNRAKCVPPLEDVVLQQKCESARKFLLSQSVDDKVKYGQKLTALGLEYQDGEWYPGLWRIEITTSDPREVFIYAPFLTKPVSISIEDYDSPLAVHRAIMAGSGAPDRPVVCLADRPGFWEEVWNGARARGKQPPRIGLKAKLLREAQWVESPPETKRYNVLTEILVDYLRFARALSENDQPEIAPTPFILEGKVWFSFRELLLHVELNFKAEKVTRNELSKFVRARGAQDAWVGPREKRRRLLCLEQGTLNF